VIHSSAQPRYTPLAKSPTGRTRAQEKAAKLADAERHWRDVCRLVDRRDNGRCRVCGRACSPSALSMVDRAERHHLTYRSRGGADETRNVLTLCRRGRGRRERARPACRRCASSAYTATCGASWGGDSVRVCRADVEPGRDLLQSHSGGSKTNGRSDLFLTNSRLSSPFSRRAPRALPPIGVGVPNILRAGSQFQILWRVVLLHQVAMVDLFSGWDGPSVVVSPYDAVSANPAKSPLNGEHQSQIAFAADRLCASRVVVSGATKRIGTMPPYSTEPVDAQCAVGNQFKCARECGVDHD